MRKQVILIMQGSCYPFGQAEQTSSRVKTNARILVRKKHETKSLQQRNQLLDKIGVVKNINNPYLMKIETVLQEENSIHVLYQYVPESLTKNITRLSENDINQIRDQLLDLAVNLADVGLRVDWDSRNIGINQRVQAKYYLDLDRIGFQHTANKSKLQRQHFKVIMELFAQFFNPNKRQSNKQSERNSGSNSRKTQNTQSQQSSILNARAGLTIDNKTQLSNLKQQLGKKSPSPVSPVQNQIKTQKQIATKKQQKQKLLMKNSRTNWKQLDHNEQFMQDFMNVLDDKSENAQSKYVSDEEEAEIEEEEQAHISVEMEDERQGQGQDPRYQEQSQEDGEEEIVWVSNPDANHQAQKGSDEEEVVWVDYRDFTDIQERAEAAIQRSTKVLQVFKKILAKNK